MYLSSPPRERVPAAVASAAAVACLGWALVSGLTVSKVVQAVAPLVSVEFTNPPPKPPEPPREKPQPVHKTAAKGAPSPRNLRNKATQVTAPMLPPLVMPPPVVAAPKPGPGNASNNGASDRIGPGQGAGGEGNGFGGGGNGGDGAGDTPPEQIRGDFKLSDLPEGLAARRRNETLSLEVHYKVGVDGRASGCVISSASGSGDLDEMACRVIEQRFRFRPSLDGDGRPVLSEMVQHFSWTFDQNSIEGPQG